MTGTDHSFLFLGPQGFMPIGYRQWGDPANPRLLFCVHGLSRNRLDFEDVGNAFAGDYRVLAPDMPGRGESGWLDNKEAYTMDLYGRVCATLLAIAGAGAGEVDWIGTSMGGLIGMALAGEANTPIRRLVINDIGPRIPAEGRRHNAAGFGSDPRFADFEAAVAWHKEYRAGFGPMPEAGWRRMTEASVRPVQDGGYALHYDPGLAVNQLKQLDHDVENWTGWAAIGCPVLTIWGTASKLLLAADLEKMKVTGPGTQILPVEGVGHAPALTGDAVIDGIRRFLES
jgi:pimeloyl-ACP methyl ester carboxylesterase